MSEVQPTRASHHTLDQSPTQEEHTSSAQASPTSVEPVTPQDPQAAGASASEQRRHLQDNVSGSQQKGSAERSHELHEEQPGGTAGLHATGSRAGKQ